MRILVGATCVVLLAAYVAWRWRRAGDVMSASAAFDQAHRQYVDALRSDPRWLRLEVMIRQRYPITYDVHGVPPNVFSVHHIALVDDRGFVRMLGQPSGATRVVAMLVRAQPEAQIYVSQDLRTGEVREDPAPYGWTYVGPPR
jgi:hypothetical protein